MFPRMNASGLMDAQTGLAIVATQLGFVQQAHADGLALQSQPKRRRAASKTSVGRQLLLGRVQTPYELVSDLAATRQLFEQFEVVAQEHLQSVVWPTEAEHIPGFADSLRGYAKAVRSIVIPRPLPETKNWACAGAGLSSTLTCYSILSGQCF